MFDVWVLYRGTIFPWLNAKTLIVTTFEYSGLKDTV